MKLSLCTGAVTLILASLSAVPASAVIVFGSSDPDFNAFDVNPPAGPLRNSGGQFQGYFGGFAATPIGPHHFLAAGHIGQPLGSVFSFHGVDYTTVGATPVGSTDLIVWQVSGTFPAWAPLFVGNGPVGPYDPQNPDLPGAEIGRPLVAWGRGTLRGGEYRVGNVLRGWLWGGLDFRLRWGVNVVAGTIRDTNPMSTHSAYIYATFDANSAGLGNFECHLSDHDSSGALFVREAGVWKLAGIHYSVDGYFATSSAGTDAFLAALFDASDLFVGDPFDPAHPPFEPFSSQPSPAPTGFYSTRVSAYLPQILSLIGSSSAAITTFPRWQAACFTPEEIAANTEVAATADPEGDGLSNLAEYAFGAAPLAPSAEARPTASVVSISSQRYAAISYRRARGLTDVTYAVEASSDLQNWSGATGTTTLVSDTADGDTNVVVVRDNTPLGPGAPRRSLRVRVTKP